MRKLLVGICLLTVSFFAMADSEYRFGPEDIISFEIWREPELSRTLLVRPDGRITFPLIGDIYVARKTLEQVNEEVTSKLRKYIEDPIVTMTVEQIYSNTVFVIGGVNRAGAYTTGTNLNVLQALTLAGGRSVYSGDDIIVLRRLYMNDDPANIAVFRRDYSDLIDDPSTDMELQGGDIVIVEGDPPGDGDASARS